MTADYMDALTNLKRLSPVGSERLKASIEGVLLGLGHQFEIRGSG